MVNSSQNPVLIIVIVADYVFLDIFRVQNN